MTVLLAALAASLFALGAYSVLQRKLSRLIIGVGLIGHGANVVFIAGSRPGTPPFIGSGPSRDFADPLPQSLVLTAIVISFGVTALLLALAYRSWLLTDDDEVDDDVADRSVGRDGSWDREVVDAEEAAEGGAQGRIGDAAAPDETATAAGSRMADRAHAPADEVSP